MKEIKRPDSTTIVYEISFHKCKSVKEVENAFAGVDPENVVLFAKSVNSETFQPEVLVVMMNDRKTIMEGCKYLIPLEYINEAEIDWWPPKVEWNREFTLTEYIKGI